MDMFDTGMRVSTENPTQSPGMRRQAIETFGEGQIDLKGMRGITSMRNKNSPNKEIDPRASS